MLQSFGTFMTLVSERTILPVEGRKGPTLSACRKLPHEFLSESNIEVHVAWIQKIAWTYPLPCGWVVFTSHHNYVIRHELRTYLLTHSLDGAESFFRS